MVGALGLFVKKNGSSGTLLGSAQVENLEKEATLSIRVRFTHEGFQCVCALVYSVSKISHEPAYIF